MELYYYFLLNTPIGCAAHALNLLLKDIMALRTMDTLYKRAKEMVRYVKGHQVIAAIYFSKQSEKNKSCPATPFGVMLSSFLTVSWRGRSLSKKWPYHISQAAFYCSLLMKRYKVYVSVSIWYGQYIQCKKTAIFKMVLILNPHIFPQKVSISEYSPKCATLAVSLFVLTGKHFQNRSFLPGQSIAAESINILQ